MPYKRPAHILFIATDTLASTAVSCASRLGNSWVEPRAAHIDPPIQRMMDWADLVITLDVHALKTLPTVPPTARHIHWAVTGMNDIEARLRSLVGGMRMLSRSTEDHHIHE